MQSNYVLAAAIAGVLASAAASAKTIDVYASGASAQRTFWFKEMGAAYCGATSNVTVFAYADSAVTINLPDYQAATCTATVTSAPAGVTSGDTLNLHYAADLGSVWGIAGSLNHSLKRMQMPVVALPNTLCVLKTAAAFPFSQYNCQAQTSYTRSTDTGGGPFLAQHASDLLLSDLEPTLFASADNWPTASAGTTNNGPNAASQFSADTSTPSLATQPSLTQLQNVQANMHILNGEVFSFIGKNIPGNPTSLSSQSLKTIFAGNYTSWNQVPEVGASDTVSGGTSIVVCRRDHGSGSEIATSVFLEQIECGAAGAVAVVNNAGVGNAFALPFVVENASSGDLKTCISGLGGNGSWAAIGMLSLGTSGSYTTFNVDGIQPNAHNAAIGAYKFYTETWGQDISATTEGSTTAPATLLSGQLFAASQSQARLSADGFTETNTGGTGGLFTTATQQVAFALPQTNTASSANYAATAPVALFTKGGNSCTTTAQNGNSN